jgi:putative nucleotidyltransferase with HDIG domain
MSGTSGRRKAGAFIPRTLAELEAGGPGRAAVLRAALIVSLLALGLFAILTVSIGASQVNLAVGDVAQADVRAPATVTYQSTIATDQARQLAADQVPAVYAAIRPRADIAAEQLDALDRLASAVSTVLAQKEAGGIDPAEVPAAIRRVAPRLSEAQAAVVAGMPQVRWDAIAIAARTVVETTQGGSVREGELQTIQLAARSNVTADLPEADRQLAGDLVVAFITPNERIDIDATNAARDQARNSVVPQVVTVRANEIILRDGEAVKPIDLEKLTELGLTRRQVAAGTLAGQGLLSIVLAALLAGYLWRFEPEIWHRNRSLLLFLLAFLGSAIAIRVAADRTLWTYVVPTSAAVLLIGILLGGSAGAAIAVSLATVAGIANRDGLEPAMYILASGVAALVTIVRAERLNAFVRTGVVVAIANVVVLTAFNLLAQRDVAAVFQGTLAGLVNAGLTVLLAVGSFATLGNVFGIMTVFQLLELANPSNRLLRRLLLETPGTYHHAVMVGNLAERAAETIGADPLLARVAAYYHDIGKMRNPLAFIENQAGARNIHDDLEAETSARIIASHIRDGIDLAYEYGLPVQIIGFIPQHHGTSKMSYFYGKALREVGGNEEALDPERFRYPGPKPQSREAAILMLSDGVEASVRSLDSKDPDSIRAMVDRIVDDRVADGQLDDADLTLKDITSIKEAFVQQLLGMYHSRIKYPDNVVPLEQRERA